MEIINNSPETSDFEEEDNVSQAMDREVPLQNAELSEEVASKAKKKTKRKAKGANQDEKPRRERLPSIYEEFEEFENQESTNIGQTELDIYLEELRMPSSACFDILAYWKERSRKSPTLARIARDILSIPITTVASESAFSIGARVLTKYRSSMKDESVQALLCARSWLYGFQELDDVDNIDKDDEIHGSVQESNSVEYVNID
ncbi:hypothetical protein P8452_28144 [Trifolium repens]|nr:hypothetical protein P8452_28144 [Trifolium repens]